MPLKFTTMQSALRFRLLSLALLLPLMLLTQRCGLEGMIPTTTGTTSITEQEAAGGLKEALTKGIGEAAVRLSETNAYFLNPSIKIPFPPEAQRVENTLRDIGFGKMADDVILSVNRAAEDAATKAKPIFIDAIKSMTIQDAMGILFGGEFAATNYLKERTSNKLTIEFKPVIQQSLDKVNATKYWTDAINTYNKIPLVTRMNPDLVDYVNGKALDGLFHVVGLEEQKIRQNPLERTSELLRKVFNYYDRNKDNR